MKNLFTILLPAFFAVSAFPTGAIGQTQPLEAPRPRMYDNTARPADQIQQTFPYNIPLRTAPGDSLLSQEVFVKNGKPTVLLFWMTTCGPCRRELEAISGKYAAWQAQADFNFYAVSIDFPHNFENFQRRVAESQWPFPAYLDTDREFMSVMPGSLNGLPQVFVLDGEGNIVAHKRKYLPGDEDLLFEEVLKLAK